MTTIATSEDFARPEETQRPALGRAADKPEDLPKQRVLIHYKRHGTVLRTRVKEATTAAMDDAKRHLEAASGIHFSYTFLVRRALDLYLQQAIQYSDVQWATEASILKKQYR
jgi:hypothetical protein